MMKRALLLLLAGLLLFAGPAMAETPAREAYIGRWVAQSVSFMGNLLPREALEHDVICSIHEDDTIVLEVNGMILAAPVIFASDGSCRADGLGEGTCLTTDSEGGLKLSLVSGVMSMDVLLVRAEDTAAPPEIVPLLGDWRTDDASALRMMPDGRVTGVVKLSIYKDRYGVLQSGGEMTGFRVEARDGQVLLRGNDAALPAAVNAAGQLEVALMGQDGSVTMLILLQGENGDAMTARPESTIFEGRWEAESFSIGTMSAPATAGDVTLEISGVRAIMHSTGLTSEHFVAVEGNVCTLTGELTEYVGTLDETGRLHLQMAGDVRVVLVRVDEAPQTE